MADNWESIHIQRIDSYNSIEKMRRDGLGPPPPLSTQRGAQPIHRKVYRQITRFGLRRGIYIALGIAVMLVWIGIIVSVANSSTNLQRKNEIEDAQAKAKDNTLKQLLNDSVGLLHYPHLMIRGIDCRCL
jgi:hypothetical protein